MDECLKKGADARRFAISLHSLEYSGPLSEELFGFSAKMEKIFKLLQDLRKREVTDKSQYAKLFKIVDAKLEWYTKAEAHGVWKSGYFFKVTYGIPALSNHM